MKKKFINYIFIISLLFSASASSNPINKINFIGLNSTIQSSLIDILTFKVGQNFTPSVSDQIIQELFSTGYFSNIAIIKNTNELDITVVENPYIKFFDINQTELNPWTNWIDPQNQLLTSDKLQEYLKKNNLSPGNIFLTDSFNKFLSDLREEYISNGYYNIEITDQIELDDENRISIELLINQGEKVKVSSMSISGSKNFSEKELLKLFKVGKANNFVLNIFTKKDQYNNKIFEEGIQALNNYYLNSGFMDFKIVDISRNLNNNNQKMDIEVQISEGIQYKLGDISFSGETGNFSSKDLRSLFTMNKGDIFNRKIIVDDIQKVIDAYSDQGYAFVDVSPITNDFIDSISVDINISLKQKVYINRINISGNTRTQDEVIRREIGISEGGLYSRTTIKNSILKLRRLGYFSDVQIDIIEIEGVDDKLDLSFKVEETQTGSLSFSVSHSNTYGVSAGFGVKEKNIFGSGNTFNANVKLADSYQRTSFYFENPFFNENAHSISYGAFLSKTDDDDIMKESYEITSKGLNFGYGIPLTENTRLNSSIEYAQNEIKCGTTFSTSDYEKTQCSVKNNDEVKLNLNWSENTLNDYMYPTDGRSNQIDFDIALPVADYKYYKINASHSSYSPIGENLTLKLTADLGIASGYGSKELPFYKRYFAGGSGSVRGFGKRTLGPEYINNRAKGGELSILGSANLISPVFFFEDSKNMRLSTFVDAGNIFEKSSNLELDELRMSVGLGFAYLSPIGAIGIHWTTPILKKSGDTIENFSFSLGTGF